MPRGTTRICGHWVMQLRVTLDPHGGLLEMDPSCLISNLPLESALLRGRSEGTRYGLLLGAACLAFRAEMFDQRRTTSGWSLQSTEAQRMGPPLHGNRRSDCPRVGGRTASYHLVWGTSDRVASSLRATAGLRRSVCPIRSPYGELRFCSICLLR
jgi:hypothetical protein